MVWTLVVLEVACGVSLYLEDIIFLLDSAALGLGIRLRETHTYTIPSHVDALFWQEAVIGP